MGLKTYALGDCVKKASSSSLWVLNGGAVNIELVASLKITCYT